MSQPDGIITPIDTTRDSGEFTPNSARAHYDDEFFSRAEKYACDPVFMQERRRLMKRIHELETIVDMLRLNETQVIRNREMTISVYKNKVQELTNRLSEKQYVEEHYRGVQESLREKEDAYARLHQQYQILQNDSDAQQKSFVEQKKTYEQACKDLQDQMSMAEKHHQQVAEQFQSQLNDLLQEKDTVQKKMRDVEEHGKIVEAELAMQHRIRGIATTVVHSARETPRPVPEPTPYQGHDRASVVTIDPSVEPRYDNTQVTTGTVMIPLNPANQVITESPRRTSVMRSTSMPGRTMPLRATATPVAPPATVAIMTNGVPATGSKSIGVLPSGYGGSIETPRAPMSVQMQYRDASPARQHPGMVPHAQSFGMQPNSARKSLVVGPGSIVVPSNSAGPQQQSAGPVRAVPGVQGMPRVPV